MGAMGSVGVHLLRLPVGEEVVPHTLHVYRLTGFIGALECPVLKDLTWGRHVGLIGVNQRSSRMSSMVLWES